MLHSGALLELKLVFYDFRPGKLLTKMISNKGKQEERKQNFSMFSPLTQCCLEKLNKLLQN